MANSSSGGGRAEAERWLEIAGRLLAARDLVGSKRFAERAMEADPMLEGVDSVLSVADVLLASQRRIGAHHVDWYAVLGVEPSADEATIRQEHRRLAGLLRLNTHAGAESASHLVADALSFLTDPSKKKLLDTELKKQSLKPAPNPNSSARPKKDKEKSTPKSAPSSNPNSSTVKVKKAYVANAFWTACPFCCHLHQYAKSYKNKSLLCPNSACRRPFHASELPVPPPVVPGTDTYYSAWGFFPMGYPKQKDLDENWKPFHPVFPWNPDKTNKAVTNGTAGAETEAPAGGSKGKKTMARKKVGRPPKRHMSGETGQVAAAQNVQAVPATGGSSLGGNGEVRGININEEAGNFGTGEEAMGDFQIDVDTTDELLGNLQNLPFLREDVVPTRII